MPRKPNQPLLEIGVLGRPHGVRGELRVHAHNADSDALERCDEIWLRDRDGRERRAAVARYRSGARHGILALDGVGDREAADRLKGARVLVPRERLARLEEGEFFVADLIGLEVIDEAGAALGRVIASREQGGIEVVTVRDGRRELQIPLVERHVARLEVDAGRLAVRDVAALSLEDAGEAKT